MYCLKGETPWVTKDTVCSIINDNINRERLNNVEQVNTKRKWSLRQLDEFTGVYGNHAYGNVTIAANESGDGLVLVYGVEQFMWASSP